MSKKQNSSTHILISLPHSIAGRLIMSSMRDGFIQNGYIVSMFDEIYQPKEHFDTLISNNKFDFIAGYDFAGLKLKIDNNLQIPCINYFSDIIEAPTSGEGYKEYKKYLNRSDSYTFYWDKELYEIAKQEIKNIFYMPHFVNTELYKPTTQTPQIDIMFAGRLDTDFRLKTWLELVKAFPDKTCAWFAIERHLKDALSRLDEKDGKLLESIYSGFIDNEPDMALALNNSKIVFNMNAQGNSSFNYRTIQAMSCARLMLCDYRNEAPVLFNNNEIIFYNNIQDAKDKIDFYLANKKAYNEIVQNARKTILKNHDAKKCTKEIISTIQNIL